MLVHPALPAGSTGSNSAPLNLDSSGNLLVNVAQGSFAVSTGAQYNSTPPTLTSGSTGPLQSDVNGKLLIAGTINASSSATYNSATQTMTNGSSNPLQSDVNGRLLTHTEASLSTPLRIDPVGTTTQPVSGTFWQATQPVSGTFWQATQPVSAASLPLPSGAATSAKQPALGTAGSASADVISVQGIASMTALKVDGSGVTQPVSIAATVTTSAAPATSGGVSSTKLVSAASTNATSVKGSAGQLYSAQCFNLNAAARYLKLYDKASAPTVGTDTPVATWLIPPSSSGFTVALSVGMVFTLGIAFALTTGITDADTGAVAASEILVNLQYK